MQTTVCAYCDHEVKITPDGVCLFCGGNLADENYKDEMEKDDFAIMREREKLNIWRAKTLETEEIIKPIMKSLSANWFQRNWPLFVIVFIAGGLIGGIFYVISIIDFNVLFPLSPSTEKPFSSLSTIVISLFPLLIIMIIFSIFGGLTGSGRRRRRRSFY